MATDIISTSQKAHIINEDPRIYGTFAEIGAGQEVARHFFLAGHASRTIAKTMSAYDMTFSDQIYGKAKRYVSPERLKKMLDHEYNLLMDRLGNKEKCFFAFANTVATSSHEDEIGSHAWMGIRLQLHPGGAVNDIVIHVRMLDRLRLSQQEALGVLGVNLVYAAWFLNDDEKMFVSSLIDSLTTDRIEVDYLSCSGPDFEQLNHKLMNLELLVQKMTPSIIFAAEGTTIQASDYLHGKPVVVLRGTFKPITKMNLDILERALTEATRFVKCSPNEIRALLEFTVQSGENSDHIDYEDYLSRIETINACGHHVLVSRFPFFFQLKQYLRHCTHEPIGIVVGSTLLPKIFDEKLYKSHTGGLLNALGKLFDENSKLLVFPYKEDKQCLTAQTFNPEKKISHLYEHLLENQAIVDILGCDDVKTGLHSKDVRSLLEKRDEAWKNYVPEEVSHLIQQKKLFGYK